MENETILKLNNLNTDFYKTVALDFDDSRQFFWAGWQELTKYFKDKKELKILDLGCGNGRFSQFLEQALPDTKINYVGLDNNEKLLGFAKKNLENTSVNFSLKQIDLIKLLLDNQEITEELNFDAIVSFGVFHHIPSFELRLKTLDYLKSKLKKDGVLIISLWQFMEFDRFKKKVIEYPDKDLENNDYILDWKRGERAYRYCHFINLKEQKKLIKNSKLKLINSLRADGKEKNVNQYLILQKG